MAAITQQKQELDDELTLEMVTSRERDPSLPDTPTLHEAGVANYDAGFWFGLLGPAGMPAPLIVRLNRVLRDVLSNAEAMRSVRAQGLLLFPDPSPP